MGVFNEQFKPTPVTIFELFRVINSEGREQFEMYSNSNKLIGQSLFRIATVYLFYKFLSNSLKVF